MLEGLASLLLGPSFWGVVLQNTSTMDPMSEFGNCKSPIYHIGSEWEKSRTCFGLQGACDSGVITQWEG